MLVDRTPQSSIDAVPYDKAKTLASRSAVYYTVCCGLIMSCLFTKQMGYGADWKAGNSGTLR
jgi:hypothetical protein